MKVEEEYLIPLSWSMYAQELSPGVEDRFNFYQGSINPTAYFGGTDTIEGWNCNFTNFQISYDNIVTQESPFTIDLEFVQIREESFEITAEITVTENITSGDNKVFFVITNWKEYSTENPWYFLVVAKSAEEDVTIYNTGDTAIYNAEFDVEMQPDWNLEDLNAVAIIQNWESLEILQAAQVKFVPLNADNQVLPIKVSLLQNYPNPFNPSTTISYDLHQDAQVELNILNAKGQEVIQLVNSQISAGQHSIIWNGNDNSGKAVPSGIYFYSLKAVAPYGGKYTSVKKMILMK